MENISFEEKVIVNKDCKNIKIIYIDIFLENIKVGDLSFIVANNIDIKNELVLQNINHSQFKLFSYYLNYSQEINHINNIIRNKILYLNDIYIFDEYRDKNIGNKTMLYLEEICKVNNINSIYLHSCPIKRIKFSRSDKIDLLNNKFNIKKDKLNNFYINLGYEKIDKNNKKIELNYFYKNL